MRDFLVKIAIRLGIYQKLVEWINLLKFEIQSRRMQRHGLDMLKAVEQVFNDAESKAFLICGTLLGAIREKGFISYDPDIDLGVIASEVPTDIHLRMEKAGFKLYNQNYIREPYRLVEETYIYNNLHLDIFYCYEEGDDLFLVSALKHETKEWKEANATDGFPTIRAYFPKTDFEQMDFLGIKVWIPSKYDEWLRALYSDSYMTPVKNWNRKDYKTRIIDTPERSYRKRIE